MSRIFYVSSSRGLELRAVGPVGKMNKETTAYEQKLKICTNLEFWGLEIEGYRTYWKDELGNHTLGMKAQNMHQLRVFGAKYHALYFLPLVPMLWHSAETPNPGTMPLSAQTQEGKSNFWHNP